MGSDDYLVDELAGDALGTLVPFAGAVGERAAGLIRKEWSRLTSKALKAAEDSSGLAREDLYYWIERDPRAIPLYLKVLWAAGMNGHDATLRAMGAVLGEAARATADGEDEAIVRAELALTAMSDLGPLHFKILAVLNESVVIPGGGGGGDNYSEFTPAFAATRAGLSEPLAAQCMLNLANAGLTELTSVLGANAFPLTELGRAVLRAAEQLNR